MLPTRRAQLLLLTVTVEILVIRHLQKRDAQPEIRVHKLIFDLIQLRENIIRCALFRRFSLFEDLTRFGVHPAQPALWHHRIYHRYARRFQKRVEFAAQPVKPARLNFDDSVFADNIRHKAAHLHFAALKIGFVVAFQRRVQSFFRKRTDAACAANAPQRLFSRL